MSEKQKQPETSQQCSNVI